MGVCLTKERSIFTKSSVSITDAALAKYDKNSNGVLEASELHALLKDAFPGQAISEQEAQTVLTGLDLNQDGSIGANELRAFLRSYDVDSMTLKRKAALVIIDVQNDFITGTLANPFKAQDIVPVINDLRNQFECVVISYDWHPHDHCSFFDAVNDGKVPIKEEKKTGYGMLDIVTLPADAERPEHQQCLYFRHAVQDTEGSACHKDLVLKDSDLKVYKGVRPNIDSYSAFFDNLKANDTGLTKMLEDNEITDVYCCGLVFDICVKSTALHGAEMGFNVFVIEDACRPFVADNVPNVKKELEEAGVEIVTAAETAASVSSLARQNSLQDYISAIKTHKRAKEIHQKQVLRSHSAR